MSTLMKAVQINSHGDISVLKLVPIPVQKPQNDQVLVKVYAAGVNPVDVYMRAKMFGYAPQLPLVLGKEAAGIVEEVGSNVKQFKKGDRVVCCIPSGGYAEYVTCNAALVVPLPEVLTFTQGAALYIAYYTAYRALIIRLKIQKGELALIHGASGAVGLAGVQIAKAHGLKVVGTAGSDEGLKVVKDAGADVVVNHKQSDHLKQALDKLGSKGFDVILENKANSNLGMDMVALNNSGRIGIVGSRGTVEVDPRFLMSTEGSVIGVTVMKTTPEEFKQSSVALLKGIADGWLRPIIAKDYEFSEEGVQQVHKDIMSDHGKHGKLVLTIIKC